MREGELSKGFYLVVFIIAVTFLVVGFYFLPSDRYDVFLGTGNSMEPTLSDGDELTVDPKQEPKPGDIIVFSCLTCPNVSSDEILQGLFPS
ncbi:MAG: S24 family peptidase [Patescibacteria group bacterium]|nr:S24 family peptidase [Patescibacteria group bacterium]